MDIHRIREFAQVLTPGSNEANTVYRNFVSNCPENTGRILNIYKITNHAVHARFMQKRKQMISRYGLVREVQLYHGTLEANVYSICKNNFDIRCVKRHKFGFGISFTEHSKFALFFCDRYKDIKWIFVARVFKNNVVDGNPEMRTLPLDERGIPFDTAQKPGGGIFIKFGNDEFCPEFLIRFYKYNPANCTSPVYYNIQSYYGYYDNYYTNNYYNNYNNTFRYNSGSIFFCDNNLPYNNYQTPCIIKNKTKKIEKEKQQSINNNNENIIVLLNNKALQKSNDLPIENEIKEQLIHDKTNDQHDTTQIKKSEDSDMSPVMPNESKGFISESFICPLYGTQSLSDELTDNVRDEREKDMSTGVEGSVNNETILLFPKNDAGSSNVAIKTSSAAIAPEKIENEIVAKQLSQETINGEMTVLKNEPKKTGNRSIENKNKCKHRNLKMIDLKGDNQIGHGVFRAKVGNDQTGQGVSRVKVENNQTDQGVSRSKVEIQSVSNKERCNNCYVEIINLEVDNQIDQKSSRVEIENDRTAQGISRVEVENDEIAQGISCTEVESKNESISINKVFNDLNICRRKFLQKIIIILGIEIEYFENVMNTLKKRERRDKASKRTFVDVASCLKRLQIMYDQTILYEKLFDYGNVLNNYLIEMVNLKEIHKLNEVLCHCLSKKRNGYRKLKLIKKNVNEMLTRYGNEKFWINVENIRLKAIKLSYRFRQNKELVMFKEVKQKKLRDRKIELDNYSYEISESKKHVLNEDFNTYVIAYGIQEESYLTDLARKNRNSGNFIATRKRVLEGVRWLIANRKRLCNNIKERVKKKTEEWIGKNELYCEILKYERDLQEIENQTIFYETYCDCQKLCPSINTEDSEIDDQVICQENWSDQKARSLNQNLKKNRVINEAMIMYGYEQFWIKINDIKSKTHNLREKLINFDRFNMERSKLISKKKINVGISNLKNDSHKIKNQTILNTEDLNRSNNYLVERRVFEEVDNQMALSRAKVADKNVPVQKNVECNRLNSSIIKALGNVRKVLNNRLENCKEILNKFKNGTFKCNGQEEIIIEVFSLQYDLNKIEMEIISYEKECNDQSVEMIDLKGIDKRINFESYKLKEQFTGNEQFWKTYEYIEKKFNRLKLKLNKEKLELTSQENKLPKIKIQTLAKKRSFDNCSDCSVETICIDERKRICLRDRSKSKQQLEETGHFKNVNIESNYDLSSNFIKTEKSNKSVKRVLEDSTTNCAKKLNFRNNFLADIDKNISDNVVIINENRLENKKSILFFSENYRQQNQPEVITIEDSSNYNSDKETAAVNECDITDLISDNSQSDNSITNQNESTDLDVEIICECRPKIDFIVLEE